MFSFNTKYGGLCGGVGLLTAVLLAGGILVACSSSTPAPEGESDQTLTVAVGSDVVSLDPQLQGDMTSMSVASNIFDTLTVRQVNGELGPGLATEWEQSDPLTWTFKIRQGVTFQDGEELDAETVAYSVNRILDPKTASPIVELVNVDKAVADDAESMRLVMKQPDPVLPAKLSLFGGVVVPKDYIEENGAKAFAERPVGTGPYSFVSRTQADQIVLEANSDYWGEPPAIKRLIFKVMPEPSAAIAALQAKQVDIVTGLTPDGAAQLNGNPDTTVNSDPGIRTYSVNLDTISDGPLAEVQVRRALNYAVDVPELIDTVQGGAAKQNATLIPDSAFGYDASITPYAHDKAKAKQLLADAGLTDGFSTTITASTGDASIAQAISGQLAKVGVTAEVKVLDAQTAKAELIALSKNRNGGMFLAANSGWTLDSVSYIQSVVNSERRSSRFDDRKADKLVIQGETETDPKARQEIYTTLQMLLHDQAPFIYMFTINNTYAMQKNVDWTMPLTGALTMASAKFK